jgi:Trk K+ transport system NAD-binding subunit
MRVAVAGAGSVGGFIANALVENSHEVLLIENDPNVAAKLRTVDGLEIHVGDAEGGGSRAVRRRRRRDRR